MIRALTKIIKRVPIKIMIQTKRKLIRMMALARQGAKIKIKL